MPFVLMIQFFELLSFRFRPFKNAHTNRDSDRELIKLSAYLKMISSLSTFDDLNHKHWESFMKNQKSWSEPKKAREKTSCILGLFYGWRVKQRFLIFVSRICWRHSLPVLFNVKLYREKNFYNGRILKNKELPYIEIWYIFPFNKRLFELTFT